MCIRDREHFQTIFDGVEDGIVVVDREDSIVFRNNAYDAMVEKHGAEFAFVDEHGEDFPREQHPLRRAAKGEEFTVDVTFVGSGASVAYTARGKSMTTDDGVELGVVTIQDCSETPCDDD